MRQGDFRTAFARRLRAGATRCGGFSRARRANRRAPIILVAVSLRPEAEALRQALLDASASVLVNMPGARLACVNVVLTSLIAIDENVDAAGDNIHIEEAGGIDKLGAAAAAAEGQDHLSSAGGARDVYGRRSGICAVEQGRPPDRRRAPARGGSPGGKVSARLAVEAPCSVTIVRAAREIEWDRTTGHAGRPIFSFAPACARRSTRTCKGSAARAQR